MFALTQRGRPAFSLTAREALAGVVVKQLGPAVLVEEEILVAVVVVVAPDGAHRDAGAGAVDVGDAQLAGDVLERAVALIAIEAIEAAVARCS